jgi:Domain of unknown function (DUF6398)
MMGPTRLNSIPKGMLPVYERIVGLCDNVCDTHLDSEYRNLARAMTGALCRKRPSPLTSGQPRTWASGARVPRFKKGSGEVTRLVDLGLKVKK